MYRWMTALLIGSLLMWTSVAGAQVARIAVSSTAFAPGGAIPGQYTCAGRDISPPLSWSGVPAEAKSLVVAVVDPDAATGAFIHWLVFNLPPTTTSLPEGVPVDGALPGGAVQGRNDFGHVGYEGPCPPPGKLHHYHFRVLALSSRLALSNDADGHKVQAALRGKVIAAGDVTGVVAAR